MRPILNRAVRGYLARFPVTEGKKALLRLTERLIRPEDPQQLAVTKHGFSLRLNLDNPEHRRIYYYGEHDERYETAIVKELVRPGMTCWDIGANIGYYTCLLSLAAGRGGRVLALEPARATLDRLLDNIRVNALANVSVLPCAVGAASGTARLHYHASGLFEGTASLLETSGHAESEEVPVVTIDSLVESHGAPDFVKIDVEGAQLDAWRGGAAFFATHSPLVMAELRDSKDREVLRAIEALVKGYGYRMFAIRKGRRVAEAREITSTGPRNFLLAKSGSAQEELLRRRAIR